MKKFAIIILIALIHFALSVFIVAITVSVGSPLSAEHSEPSFVIKALVVATKILHYPIISHSLYSRQWFPGGWIHIPIFINSLLWAVGIYSLFYIYTAFKKYDPKKKKKDGSRKN
jgi:hypothetical protein